MTLKNRKIVITGSSSGIGAETARMVKEQQGYVIGIDRNESKENVDLFVQADLSSPTSIESAVAAIDGNIDGLCNIAGLPPTHDPVSVLRVNFLGLRHLTELLVKKMNDNGAIVNVGSLAGLDWAENIDRIKSFLKLRDFDDVGRFCEEHNIIGGQSYFFTKETLNVWTMMNRWTWRDRGIRMNNINPGPVNTPITDDFNRMLGERAEEDNRIMDRPGEPSDIAPVAAFLLSEDSRWIRGAVIPCDGGMFSHVQCEKHGFQE